MIDPNKQSGTSAPSLLLTAFSLAVACFLVGLAGIAFPVLVLVALPLGAGALLALHLERK